jgi:hypothetical protein
MRGSESTSQMKVVSLKHAWRWPTTLRGQKVAARLGWSAGTACPSALVNLRSLLTKDPVFLLLRVTVSVTFPGGAVEYLVICV